MSSTVGLFEVKAGKKGNRGVTTGTSLRGQGSAVFMQNHQQFD